MITTGSNCCYLILILAFVLSSPKTAYPISVTLSVLYIAYTAYDLYVMLGLLKERRK
jgi:FtsH-binding integral membrane protein